MCLRLVSHSRHSLTAYPSRRLVNSRQMICYAVVTFWDILWLHRRKLPQDRYLNVLDLIF